MTFTLALTQAEHLPAIADISNWAAQELPANFATQPEPLDQFQRAWEATHRTHPWLVALADGAVIGFAKAAPHKPRGAYAWAAETSVYVAKPWHGKGVGRALYGRLLPLLEAQGFVTLIAGITDPNPPSERLHASFGFVRCGTFHRVGWKFGQWWDVGYWERHLSQAAPPGSLLPVQGL